MRKSEFLFGLICIYKEKTHFAYDLDIFQIIGTLAHPHTLQIIWILFISVQTIRRFTIPSDYSLDHLDLFWMNQILLNIPDIQWVRREKLPRVAKIIADTLRRYL